MSERIAIANRLLDGRVVYLGAAGWSPQVEEAERAATDEAAEALLGRAKESFARNEVVDVYLIELDAAGAKPRSLRERIRSQGPTVRSDLGYQAGEVS
jgi:hypothetical protein